MITSTTTSRWMTSQKTVSSPIRQWPTTSGVAKARKWISTSPHLALCFHPLQVVRLIRTSLQIDQTSSRCLKTSILTLQSLSSPWTLTSLTAKQWTLNSRMSLPISTETEVDVRPSWTIHLPRTFTTVSLSRWTSRTSTWARATTACRNSLEMAAD